MRRTIRSRWAASGLLLSALMAALMASPALAASASHFRLGGGHGAAAGIPDARSALQAVVAHRPDGRIQLGSYGSAYGETAARRGPLVGNNVYNASGAVSW